MTVWVLWLALVTFNDDGSVYKISHTPVHEYLTQTACEKEKERLWMEFKKAYKENDFYFYCDRWPK